MKSSYLDFTPAELLNNYILNKIEHKTNRFIWHLGIQFHLDLPQLAFLITGCGRTQGIVGPPRPARPRDVAQLWEARQFSGLLMSGVVSGKDLACE